MLSLFLSSFVASTYCLASSDVSVGFCSRRSLRIESSYETKLVPRQRIYSVGLRENKENKIERIISKVSDIVANPIEIPFSSNQKVYAPLGYLIILGLLNIAVLPLLTSIFLDVSFITYFFFGRSLFEIVDDDDEESSFVAATDLIALTGSFFTAGLLSPQGLYPRPDSNEIQLVGVCCCILLFTSLICNAIPDKDLRRDQKFLESVDEEDPSRQLLNLWDKKFEAKAIQCDEQKNETKI